jgi:hypothetical protein
VIRKSSKVRRVVATLTIGVGGILLLSSCIFVPPGMKALPKEERYQYINQVKDDLDYKTSGKILSEQYDKNEGLISPSYFYAELEGEETFTILSDRVQALPEIKCTYLGEDQARCRVNLVDITITKSPESENLVSFELLDSYSGKRD